MDRFVGRGRELRQVTAACKEAAAGRGSLVVVSGEAGIGKTRFCAEVADQARRSGLMVVTARCWVDGGAPALWPWWPILRQLCGREGAELVGSDPEGASAGRDRFERFAAVTDCLAVACASRPVCLVVDDVHGADAGTLLLIRYVVQSLRHLPLAMVLGRRSGEPTDREAEARLLEEIEQEGTQVVLPGFDLDEATAFLASQGLADPEPDLLQALFRLTGGNPLFLRRIAALGAGGLARGLPSGLQVAIEEAWNRLSPLSQQVIRSTSVLGLDPSIREAAAVTRTDPIVVLDAVAEAQTAGLVDAAGSERFAFSHELVRSTLEGALPTGDRLDAHARAAAVVAGDGPVVRSDRLARRAHHALAAAARSVDDARLAVVACRPAARSMIRSLAYEQADALLTSAVKLHEPASLGDPSAELLVQWAQAALHCGRLTEARLRFDLAASAAEREGDRVMLAEAALGSGGHWLHEHRIPVERSRVLALQRTAQAVLPEGHHALACRLQARLAAEAAFDGGPLQPLLEALEDARRCGDALAHAEALQLSQHALFSPEHNQLRLALGDEQVRVASEAGNGVLALMGLYWRAVNLFHLGDKRALRALEELRERANALAHQEMLYLVAVIDVMLLIREGRLAEAEAEAQRCYELGEATGQDDAFGYLSGHIVAIRWAQGREGELLEMAEELAAWPARVVSDFVFGAIAAAIAAHSGRLDRARAGLDRLASDGLAGLHRFSTWMCGMTAIAETAIALGDEAVAREAHELLSPFADLPTVVSGAMACLGSTRRPLGLAASTFGDLDQAVEHLEQAVADNHRFGNRPFAAIAQADLAATLARRNRPDDRARAVELFRQAAVDADDMGMTTRADTWRSELTVLEQEPASGRATEDEAVEKGLIRRMGPGWLVAVAERSAVVPDLVGMRYLVELLTHPGDAIPALSLASQGELTTDVAVYELLDEEARDAYSARVRELTQEIGECEADNDIGRAEALRAELDALVDQLEIATGLGNRPRTFINDPERARTAVRKAIKRAIDTIDGEDPGIAEHLRRYIVTGTRCSYMPPPDAAIEWSVRR